MEMSIYYFDLLQTVEEEGYKLNEKGYSKIEESFTGNHIRLVYLNSNRISKKNYCCSALINNVIRAKLGWLAVLVKFLPYSGAESESHPNCHKNFSYYSQHAEELSPLLQQSWI